jgi:hypothetical protein
MNYKLPRKIWTLDDFDDMAWDDCLIHAISLKSNQFGYFFCIFELSSWI